MESIHEREKPRRRILLEYRGEDARTIVDLKIKLLREKRTLSEFVIGAIKDRMAMEAEDEGR